MTTVRISRLPGYPGPDLVIGAAEEIARVFFINDPSGAFGLSGGQPNSVTAEDIRLLNSVMRARTSPAKWTELTGAGELPWLSAIDSASDLIEQEDPFWHASLRPAVEVALKEAIGPGRARSVATKILHMKRPRLFPILDALVIQQLGVPTEGGPEPVLLLDHLRLEGRRNIEELREVRASLSGRFGSPSLIRLLDVLLWSTHPVASIAPHLTAWTRSIGPSSASDNKKRRGGPRG